MVLAWVGAMSVVIEITEGQLSRVISEFSCECVGVGREEGGKDPIPY